MKGRRRLYFSFRSPYSWLTVERLRRDVDDLFGSFECVPYWDPDPGMDADLHARGAELPYTQMSKAKHLYVLGDTKRAATRLGLSIHWPVDIDCRWELPHLAFLLARQESAEERLYDALVEARWGRGEDICRPDIVRKAALSVGLDGEAMANAADDEALRKQGLECLVQAYEDDIFGVPYVLIGRERFWGLDRAELVLERLAAPETESRPRRATTAVAAVAGAAYDNDTAGGCG
jgi:2-hydroxychromene-2-carboxylate isomerase